MVLFVFQFYQVCNFGKFINFGIGTVRSERVEEQFCNVHLKKKNFPIVQRKWKVLANFRLAANFLISFLVSYKLSSIILVSINVLMFTPNI